MRVKVMDRTGIRIANAEDVPQLLQMRDLIEFACGAEELYDEIDPPPPTMKRKGRYDWREEESDVPALCRNGPGRSSTSRPLLPGQEDEGDTEE